MVKTLYEHFKVLYAKILASNPSIAAEHTLRQEEEVYQKSTKLTYRNVWNALFIPFSPFNYSHQAVITSVAALKRREFPDSMSHPSVGTEDDIVKREEARKSMAALRLTSERLEPYVLSLDELKKWGYIIEIPPGPGGEEPHAEDTIKKCERCTQPFKVVRRQEVEECKYHWGRPFSSKANGMSVGRTMRSHFTRIAPLCRREATRIFVLLADYRRGTMLRGLPRLLRE